MSARLLTVWFAVVASSVYLLAHATDYPKRKPGLWEVTRSSPVPQLPPQVSRVCLDAATDQLFYQLGVSASQKLCSKTDIHTVGGQLVIDAVCTIGGSQTTSHSAFTFHGDSAYHEETTVHHDSTASAKRPDLQITSDAKWLGACTADMKPGDIVIQPSPMMPASMRMNIHDLLKDTK